MPDPRSLPSEDAAAEREVYERIGYTRREVEEARARLRELERNRDELRSRKEDLSRQIDVVRAEVEALRAQLTERLGAFCALDDVDQRTASVEIVRRIEAIRASATYRITAGVLAVVNRLRGVVTFAWLFGKRHP